MQQAGEGRSIPRPSGGSGCECACRVGAGSGHMKAGTSILRRGKYACECRCLNRPGVGGHVGISVSRPEGGSGPVSLCFCRRQESSLPMRVGASRGQIWEVRMQVHLPT